MSYAQYHQSLTLTATNPTYTFGTGGTLTATATPVQIYGAQSVQGNFRSPIKIMSFAEFDASIEDPVSTLSVFAKVLAVDNAYPSMNLRVWPTPAASPASLFLDYYGVLTAFATLGGAVTLSPAYELAIGYNFAASLVPQYGIRGRDYSALIAMAESSKMRIQALNNKLMGNVPPQAAA
jgi:hypothetical protein